MQPPLSFSMPKYLQHASSFLLLGETGLTSLDYMGVSKNRGFPPKSSILIGFSIIFTIHFGVFSLFFGGPPTYNPQNPPFETKASEAEMACKRSWHWPPQCRWEKRKKPNVFLGFQWTESLKSPQHGICRKPHPYFLEAEDDIIYTNLHASIMFDKYIYIFPLLTNYLELFGFMIRGRSFVGSYLTKRHYTSFE